MVFWLLKLKRRGGEGGNVTREKMKGHVLDQNEERGKTQERTK